MNYGIRSIASRLCTPQIQAPLPTPLTLPYVCLRQLLAALSLTLTCLLALLPLSAVMSAPPVFVIADVVLTLISERFLCPSLFIVSMYIPVIFPVSFFV